MLDVREQTDPGDNKVRPDDGLDAVLELSPGLLGPFTTIYKSLVVSLADKFR